MADESVGLASRSYNLFEKKCHEVVSNSYNRVIWWVHGQGSKKDIT